MTLDSIKSDSGSNSGTTKTEPPAPEISSKPPTTSSDPDPDLICPVCNSPSISSCRNCKKISYCGKAHQRLHWKWHKSECFPLIHQYDPILGSRLIATRNIKAGEIIWKEKSLLSGPGLLTWVKPLEKAGESLTIPDPSLCLGCYRVVKRDYSCTFCSWPICGPNCDGKGDHEKLECKIFIREQGLRFDVFGEGNVAGESQQPPQWHWTKYGAITILRGVLFKELDPPRWKKILDLDDMWNGVECDNFVKPHNTDSGITTHTDLNFGQFCREFIMSLNLLYVTEEDVALVLRVVSHRHCEVYGEQVCNLLQHSPHTNVRNTFHLFYTAYQATQNCVPNCSWIIQQSPVEIQLRALLPIQFGRTVSLSYANVEEDIIRRQRQIARGSGESSSSVPCNCARCHEEPSELGTFFSALKCPDGVSHENSHENSTESVNNTNWLLPSQKTSRLFEEGPSQTKMKELMWSCHECGLTLEPNCYMEVVAEIEKELCDICCVHGTRNDGGGESKEKIAVGGSPRLQLIENLESLVEKHCPSSVHPNHVTMFKIESILLREYSTALGEADLMDEKWTGMVERFSNLCRKWLEVGDVLWPGLSRQRGQLLYYYQQALVIQLIFSISRRMRGESSENEDEPTVKCEPEGKNKEKEIQDLRQIQQSLLEKQFLKILSIRKVVVDIFCYDDVGQIGRKFADSLVRKCPEIELLKLYVFQNSSNKKFS